MSRDPYDTRDTGRNWRAKAKRRIAERAERMRRYEELLRNPPQNLEARTGDAIMDAALESVMASLRAKIEGDQ